MKSLLFISTIIFSYFVSATDPSQFEIVDDLQNLMEKTCDNCNTSQFVDCVLDKMSDNTSEETMNTCL